MARLWTDEQEAHYRATPRPGGRWSGGIFFPADAEDPTDDAKRPSFLKEVMRAMRDIRHE
jgi:hypothetical protein